MKQYQAVIDLIKPYLGQYERRKTITQKTKKQGNTELALPSSILVNTLDLIPTD